MGERGRGGTALAVLLLLFANATWADAERESTVRAAFLFRLAFFIEWPESAFAAADSPLTLCIDPANNEVLGRTLVEQTRGRSINDRALQIRVLAADEHASGCHIAYFGDRASPRPAEAWTVAVVESLHQLERDGALALVREQGQADARLVFVGVRERLQDRPFTVSSKLLQLLRFHRPES